MMQHPPAPAARNASPNTPVQVCVAPISRLKRRTSIPQPPALNIFGGQRSIECCALQASSFESPSWVTFSAMAPPGGSNFGCLSRSNKWLEGPLSPSPLCCQRLEACVSPVASLCASRRKQKVKQGVHEHSAQPFTPNNSSFPINAFE